MNILKDWSKFEKTLLFGNIIVVSTIGIIFKADLLTTACSIIGINTALLLAKGKNLGQLMGISANICILNVTYVCSRNFFMDKTSK